MMRRVYALIFLLAGFMPGSVWAQDPQITVTADQEEVVVGQPYLLRIKVLVPTFMPSAPVFPTFEVPGLIVRLPERSTGPVSEPIDGETWSGVQRTFRIYPTRGGATEIPAQQISIVYKDTETNEDVPLTVDVPATTIRATVPSGARALDPLIIAQGVTIEQGWQVADGVLAVGDAVGRTLEIAVDGASALFVPPLLETAPPRSDGAQADEAAAPPFLAYPEDAKVTESIERGIMSGTRQEQVSYIAQAGGVAVFPDITLRWYNLGTGEIEEIVLEGRSVEVAMPPVQRAPVDWSILLRLALLLVGLALLGWAARKVLLPPLQTRLGEIRRRYDATAHAVHRDALRAARAQDLNGLLGALDERARRGCAVGDDLAAALGALTQSTYRDDAPPSDISRHWHTVQQALNAERPGIFAPHPNGRANALPALNPFAESGQSTVYFKDRQ